MAWEWPEVRLRVAVLLPVILPSDTSWISSEAPRATAAGGISNVAMSRFSEASSLSRPLANFAAPLVVFFSRRYSSPGASR